VVDWKFLQQAFQAFLLKAEKMKSLSQKLDKDAFI